MVNRIQEQKEEGRSVETSKSAATNMSFTCSGKFLNRKKFRLHLKVRGKSQLQVNLKAGREVRNPTQTSIAQVKLQDAYPWRVDGKRQTEKPVATEESGDVDFSESETWSFLEEEVTERPVAYRTATEKPVASSTSENSGKS